LPITPFRTDADVTLLLYFVIGLQKLRSNETVLHTHVMFPTAASNYLRFEERCG